MATYKNDYKKNEDEMMWELHELRHKIWKEIKNKSIEEINDEGKMIFAKWKKERNLIKK